MSLLWLVPPVILLIGVLPVLVLSGRAAEEAEQVRDEVARLRGLRPVLAEVRSGASEARAAALGLRRR